MSVKPESQEQLAAIQLVSGPELRSLELDKEAEFENPPEDQKVGIKMNLALNRIAEYDLGVELSLRVEDIPHFSAQVTYRSVFHISEEQEDATALNSMLRQVGGRVGPNVLYPFIRETLVSTLQKAGMPAIIPPLVNFGKVFDLGKIVIPPTAASAEGDPD